MEFMLLGLSLQRIPLDELVPLQRNNDGQVITQYFMGRCGVYGTPEDGLPRP